MRGPSTTYELRTFGNVSGMTVNFATVTNIAAGQPYLIRPAADVVDPTFEGVDIVAGEPSLEKDGEFGMKGTYGLTSHKRALQCHRHLVLTLKSVYGCLVEGVVGGDEIFI